MREMKSRFGKIFLVTVIAVSMLATSFAFADTKADSVISQNKAKSVFSKKLPAKADIKYLKLTRDDGAKVYKGKAVKGNYVYSIDIGAYSGKVLDYDRDYEGSKYSASKVGAVSKSTIRSKIRRRVPNAVIIYVKLTRDDGRYVYEAEAYKNGYEYDFEYTKGGRLIESEKDKV